MRASSACLLALVVGCGDDPPTDDSVHVTEPLRIDASSDTRSELGVAAWGASSDAVRGYDASGKAVVALKRKVAHGEGVDQVFFTVDGKTHADMHVEVAAKGGKVVVAHNAIGKSASARSVVEHLASDLDEHRPPTHALLTQSRVLSNSSSTLVECTSSLLDNVTSLVDSVKSCLSGCSGSDIADGATQAVEQAKSDAQQCAQNSGQGQGEGQGQGQGQGGGQGAPDMSQITDALKCIPKDPSFWMPIMAGVAATVSQAANGTLSHDTSDSKDAVDFDLPKGTSVTAMSEGVVSMAGDDPKQGKYILLAQADGSDSLYAHLATVGVKAGDEVKQGQVIGTVGSTGDSTGPHLHVQRQTRCGQVTCETLPLSFSSGQPPNAGDAMEQCK